MLHIFLYIVLKILLERDKKIAKIIKLININIKNH